MTTKRPPDHHDQANVRSAGSAGWARGEFVGHRDHTVLPVRTVKRKSGLDVMILLLMITEQWLHFYMCSRGTDAPVRKDTPLPNGPFIYRRVLSLVDPNDRIN